ncbi:MAG: hypothetical protein ACR2HL_03325 [Methylocystis sp.]
MNTQRLQLASGLLFFLLTPCSFSLSDDAANMTYLTNLVRHEGLKCDKALRVEKALIESLPDENSWMLRCTNASYWIQVIPNVFTHIEKVDARDDLSTVGRP